MVSRALVVGLVVAASLLAIARPAASDPPRAVSSYYLARTDPRLCPSPMCGGLWMKLVNREAASCADGVRRGECYVVAPDLSSLSVDEKGRVLLGAALAEGRALARGTLVRGRVQGFPELATLVVTEVWVASSSQSRLRGVFRKLRDRGLRCVAAPCFSTHAAALNSGRHLNVSAIDLGASRAPAHERQRALQPLPETGLVAAGRVVVDPDAGTGPGRVLVASQFYVRAAGR
jgi:hypothetical protein